METLSKIAKIIKDYNDYDVLVEGNTDNIPISRTNIRAITGTSPLCAHLLWCRRFRMISESTPHDSRQAAAANTTRLPTTTPKRAASATAAPRSSSPPKLDQFLDLIDKAPRRNKGEHNLNIPSSTFFQGMNLTL